MGFCRHTIETLPPILLQGPSWNHIVDCKNPMNPSLSGNRKKAHKQTKINENKHGFLHSLKLTAKAPESHGVWETNYFPFGMMVNFQSLCYFGGVYIAQRELFCHVCSGGMQPKRTLRLMVHCTC